MLPAPFSTVSLISWKWLGQQVESPDTLLLFLKTITNKMQAPISSWFLTSMRKSKNHAVRNPIHFETVCKKEVCGKDKVSFEHSKRRSAGGTDVIDIFNTKPARSKGLSAQSFLNHQVWSPPKGPLCKKFAFWITKVNFQLLIFGFYCKLVSECALPTDKANKKAAFSVTWMKTLGNFQVGKASQEWLFIKRFLVRLQSESQVSPEVVHAIPA